MPSDDEALETAGYRVIAMDCRGHGQSGKPPDAVRRMAGLMRGVEVVQILGAGHSTSVRPAAEPRVAFLTKRRRN